MKESKLFNTITGNIETLDYVDKSTKKSIRVIDRIMK